MVQKYFPARSLGDAHVSRSSSRVSLRSHTSSQLQCRGFPPKLSTSAVRGDPFILAYTGIRRKSGSGGIFFSLLEVMSSLMRRKQKKQKTTHWVGIKDTDNWNAWLLLFFLSTNCFLLNLSPPGVLTSQPIILNFQIFLSVIYWEERKCRTPVCWITCRLYVCYYICI